LDLNHIKGSRMVRIIPGVEIQVVKEIVPQQLHPAGIVGLIGPAEKGPILTPTPTTSYREFAEKFGSNPDYTLTRDAKLCFQNGVAEVFATRIMAAGGKDATLTLKDEKKKDTVRLISKLPGEAGNSIRVVVAKGMSENSVRLEISNGGKMEIWDNLVMSPANEFYLVDFLNKNSKLVSAEDLGSSSEFPNNNPAPIEEMLSGGTAGELKKEDYEAALEKLEMEPDIDVVYACGVSDPAIHAIVDAHCKNMSRDAKNRIGIGTVASGEDVKSIVKRTEVLASDRFVLVAPYGVAGAVAGLISRLNYFESPTFKPITGISNLERRYTPAEQMELIKAGICCLDAIRGRGIVVVKGITTSGEQISVMRVADRAVRGVKNVADNFIGTLNSPGGRMALREKLTEFLISMEREGAIVPSVDLKHPAFLVDVYCSEMDFAQGIVRVDVAVRPVRAMDYIYATITVQA
jgi:hypothetical protein